VNIKKTTTTNINITTATEIKLNLDLIVMFRNRFIQQNIWLTGRLIDKNKDKKKSKKP
jgi:hypothetical protein